jgi:hypothetical protein
MKTIASLLMASTMFVSILNAAEDPAISDCAGIGWHFKIAPYLSIAKSLQDQGREKAIMRLQSWADSKKHDDQVVILCRMLFETKDNVEFRRPLIGGATFMGGTDYADWPLEPIALYEGVPILITYGYILGGSPEPSRSYLDFCIKNCTWRQDRYSVRSADKLKMVVTKWVTQGKWAKPLSDRDLAFFIDQAQQDGDGQPSTRTESK